MKLLVRLATEFQKVACCSDNLTEFCLYKVYEFAQDSIMETQRFHMCCFYFDCVAHDSHRKRGTDLLLLCVLSRVMAVLFLSCPLFASAKQDGGPGRTRTSNQAVMSRWL